MRLGPEVLCDLRRALEHEWLLANGLGGTACGTAAGAPARRSHALLTAASPHGRLRTVLLTLDERLQVEGAHHDLASRILGGNAARPAGHRLLEEFTLAPFPTWRFRAAGAVLEKSLFLVREHNALAVQYRLLGGPAACLTVSPLVVARAPEALQRELGFRGAAQGVPGRVRIETLPGGPTLSLWHNGTFMPARAWVRGLLYPLETPGPEAAAEDAFVPGYVEAELAPGASLHLVLATEDDLFRALAAENRLGTPPPHTLAECVALLAGAEQARQAAWRDGSLERADYTARQAAAAHGGPAETTARRREPLIDARQAWAAPLAAALEAGLARRAHRLTLLAGLPGAPERGAESLRAVAGLVTLRAFDEAREVLRGSLEYLDEGLAPESFDPDDGTPHYGDPEPTLWLVHAADLFARRAEDPDFLREALYPALEGALQFYRAGTRHGVRMDQDGLLSAGEGPAASKRADVNALWYHALVAMAQLARLVGRRESGAFYLAWAREHQRCFHERLWDGERGCLYHALTATGPVPGLTPSQLLAASLPPPLLAPERAASLIETVERELVTPWGLRETPGSARVAPAWLGPLISATLRVRGRGPEVQAGLRARLEQACGALGQGLQGYLPERYELTADGARPAGEPASVLAAAELLRAWVEELDLALEPAGVA